MRTLHGLAFLTACTSAVLGIWGLVLWQLDAFFMFFCVTLFFGLLTYLSRG